jgi:hypothetical protein
MGVATLTTCSVPSQATSGNNGNIAGYFYRDTTNSALQHKTQYTYDNLNRLTGSIATPVSPGTARHNLDFSYDRWGNMTCVTDGQTSGPCPNWTFDTSKNQISTALGFSYDAAGNVATDGSFSYSWDAESRMKTAGTADYSVTYVYDGDGKRIAKVRSNPPGTLCVAKTGFDANAIELSRL